MSMKLVVLGAGGFIGGWLCEELADRKDVTLVACVRQWSSAVRLARRGLEVVQLDLEAVTGDVPVLTGADVVVNVSMPAPEREPELALRLYSACAVAGVRKFIQFSSMAVYGDQVGDLDEDTPLAPSGEYGRGKAEMERRLLAAVAGSGPQLFILRPTIVYGPFSDAWTVRYARRIAVGRWRSLGWAGAGTCNLVHVQDVAESVVLAAWAQPDSKSHVLNINGPELVTWNEYIARFGDALEVGGRTHVNPLLFSLTSTAVNVVRKTGSWIKRKSIPIPLRSAPGLMRTARSAVDLYPAPEELHLLRQKVRCSRDRAARVLGFSPSMSLDEGLRQSVAWCRVHGVV
jgi:nucleoside-diphosphate-sugar epimerase